MADELIKRSEALHTLENLNPWTYYATEKQKGQCEQWERDYTAIEQLAPVDAVPVVRCKDCIFWDRKRISCEGLARCATGEGGIRYRSCSDYCSKGKRKDGEDDNGRTD